MDLEKHTLNSLEGAWVRAEEGSQMKVEEGDQKDLVVQAFSSMGLAEEKGQSP